LRSMEWSQVDLAAGEIRLSGAQCKNGKPRTIPIYGEMEPFLELALTQRDLLWPGCTWVFHYKGRQIGSHIKGWKKACKAAGLPDLHFHDLRRSAVRSMERAGVPRHVATGITGHLTESVYKRYDIVSPRDLQEAGRTLGKYFTAHRVEPQVENESQISTKVQQQPVQ
jgi:integrase